MHRPHLRFFVWLAFIKSTLDILIKDSNLAFGVNIRYIVRCTISKPEVNTSISSDRGTNLFKPPQFSLYKETMTYMYKRKKIKQLLNLTCSYLQLLKSLFVNDQLISLTRVKLQQFSIVLIFFSVLKIENKHKILQYCVVSLQASTPGQKKKINPFLQMAVTLYSVFVLLALSPTSTGATEGLSSDESSQFYNSQEQGGTVSVTETTDS